MPDTKLVQLDWHWGLWRGIKLANGADWMDESFDPVAFARQVFAHPACAALERLFTGVLRWDFNHRDVPAVIGEAGRMPWAKDLRKLHLGDLSDVDVDMAHHSIGDVGDAITRAFPGLDDLVLHSGDQGWRGDGETFGVAGLALPRLRRLTVETCAMTTARLEALIDAKLPALETLDLWFGSRESDAAYELADLTLLLSGERLPAVRSLGLCNSDLADDIVAALVDRPIAARLESLDSVDGHDVRRRRPRARRRCRTLPAFGDARRRRELPHAGRHRGVDGRVPRGLGRRPEGGRRVDPRRGPSLRVRPRVVPVTIPAHQLLVVPLIRIRGGRLPGAALAVGSVLPDVAFVVGGYPLSGPAHELYGPLFLAPTLGVALYVYAERVLAPGLRRAVPERWARLFVTRGIPPARGWGWVLLALLIGAVTHVVLDGFTHHWMWPARDLYGDIYIGPQRLTRWLQHATSLVASIFAIVWARRRIRACPPTVEAPGWRRRLGLAIAAAFAGGVAGLGLGLALFGTPVVPHDYATLLCPMADVALVAWTLGLRRGLDRRAPRAAPGALEQRLDELAGVAARDLRDLLGRAGRDDLAAGGAALGAEIDDPVGGLDDVEVVLDDEHGVAVVDEAVEHLEQLLDVVEVEAGGRLVEQVERAAGLHARELARELDALGFAARQRRRRLAERQVAEADVDERLHDPRRAACGA